MKADRTGVPPFLVGAAAVFWGWQTGNAALGAALALLVEAPRFVPFRLDLSDADYRRVADFCAVLLAGVVVLFFVNRGAARGVLSSLQWLPAALAPLYLAQLLGPGMQTSALFLYVRRQLRRDPSYPNPVVDLSGPYVALMVVAAGAANVRNEAYFLGVLGLAAWALFALRPRSVPLAAPIALLCAAAALGYAGQAGLHHMQGLLEEWVEDWLVILPNDPERTRTRIGAVGRIKQHDSVALRLYAKPSDPARPKLLHLASFNEYREGTWIAREPAAGEPVKGSGARSAPIVLRTQGGRALLPLPAGTVDILGLGDTSVRTSWLGSVLADVPKGWLRYEASYGEAPGHYAPPGPLDLAVPEAERAMLEQVASELSLGRQPPAAMIGRLARHFDAFRYTTWRESGPAAGNTGLGDFLTSSRAGHCEYFAAATTLLLRAAGIPARYATGYAAIEYSELEGAWLVRARHAHAWSRAYIDGRWVDVDLTPPSWAEEEAELAPPWEKLLDLARWAGFRWSTRSEGEISPLWWIAGALLAVVLAASLIRRRTVRLQGGAATPPRRWTGADSEFYAAEKALAARFRPREPHEPLACWFSGVQGNLQPEEKAKFRCLLELHQRYRFDPLGLSAAEREALRAAKPAP